MAFLTGVSHQFARSEGRRVRLARLSDPHSGAAIVSLLSSKSRWSRWVSILLLTGASLLTAAVMHASNENVEIHVKAAYLLHFVRYVSWPNASPGGSGAPLILGVVGRDPIADVLDELVAGKTVNNRPIKVKRFSPTEPIERCDILFVPRSESKQLPALLNSLAGTPVLTVSDKDRFAITGGMIEFLLVDDTIRFNINNEIVERSGLKLSSELLRVAYSITGKHK